MCNVVRPCVHAKVFWGVTGSGKTHLAWQEAGPYAYIKNPNTKWWDGYQNQPNVIIDEFIGNISVNYLLTWFDKYPCNVEVKGYTVPLSATNFWITSNVSPDEWYPDANDQVKAALRRRLMVTHFDLPFGANAYAPPAPVTGGAQLNS